MHRFKTGFFARAALALLMAAGAVALAEAEDEQPNPPEQSWSFHGVFGKYDQAQLQRGFQVYKEVCSTCHRLSIPFRTLEDPDGPGYSVAQVKTPRGELSGRERGTERQGGDVQAAGYAG